MGSLWFARVKRFLGIRPSVAAEFAAVPQKRLSFSKIAAQAQKLGAAGLLYQGRLGEADVWLLLTPTDTFEHHMLVGHPQFLLAYGERLIKTDAAAMPALASLRRKKKKKRVVGARYESVLACLHDALQDTIPQASSYGVQFSACDPEWMRVDGKKAQALRRSLLGLTQKASMTWKSVCHDLQTLPAEKASQVARALQTRSCERLLPQPPAWKRKEYRRRGVLLRQAACGAEKIDQATLRMVREKPITDASGKSWPLTGIDLVWILDSWELADLFPDQAVLNGMEKLVQEYFGDTFPLTAGRAAVAAAGLLLPHL